MIVNSSICFYRMAQFLACILLASFQYGLKILGFRVTTLPHEEAKFVHIFS